nr:uncharacterized protein LOC129531993 [Gorilla gorilla gorilla]
MGTSFWTKGRDLVLCPRCVLPLLPPPRPGLSTQSLAAPAVSQSPCAKWGHRDAAPPSPPQPLWQPFYPRPAAEDLLALRVGWRCGQLLLAPILVHLGCRNKIPYTAWLRNIRNVWLTVLEDGGPRSNRLPAVGLMAQWEEFDGPDSLAPDPRPPEILFRGSVLRKAMSGSPFLKAGQAALPL